MHVDQVSRQQSPIFRAPCPIGCPAVGFGELRAVNVSEKGLNYLDSQKKNLNKNLKTESEEEKTKQFTAQGDRARDWQLKGQNALE